MIEEAYVSFETAKLLKEKGFDESCDNSYTKDGEFVSNLLIGHTDGASIIVSNQTIFPYKAPSQQMAMRWLREVHNRVIGISMGHEENEGNNDHCNPDKWYYIFDVMNEKGVYREEEQPDPFTNEYATYEEAVEAAIKYTLENLI